MIVFPPPWSSVPWWLDHFFLRSGQRRDTHPHTLSLSLTVTHAPYPGIIRKRDTRTPPIVQQRLQLFLHAVWEECSGAAREGCCLPCLALPLCRVESDASERSANGSAAAVTSLSPTVACMDSGARPPKSQSTTTARHAPRPRDGF